MRSKSTVGGSRGCLEGGVKANLGTGRPGVVIGFVTVSDTVGNNCFVS